MRCDATVTGCCVLVVLVVCVRFSLSFIHAVLFPFWVSFVPREFTPDLLLRFPSLPVALHVRTN